MVNLPTGSDNIVDNNSEDGTWTRYNLGVTNILKDNKGLIWDGKAKNSVIMLTVGYKIPF